ncbi:hypothetical protein GCM10009670_27530 [Citricoccus alkalitolerans]
MRMEPGRPGGVAVLACRQDRVVRHGFRGQCDEEFFRLIPSDMDPEDAGGPGPGTVLEIDEFGVIEMIALPVEDLSEAASDGC